MTTFVRFAGSSDTSEHDYLLPTWAHVQLRLRGLSDLPHPWEAADRAWATLKRLEDA